MSQTELAEKTDIPQWEISDLELEKRQPTETERNALCEVLEGDNG